MRKIQGKHIFIALVAFFAVIFFANLYLILKAVAVNKGMVIDDSYQKGINYNDVIKVYEDDKLAVTQANITISFESFDTVTQFYVRLGANNKTIQEQGLALSEGVLRLIRPLNPDLDRKVDLECLAESCNARMDRLEKGAWDVNGFVTDVQGQTYPLSQRIVVN